jgi:hypothetical protein
MDIGKENEPIIDPYRKHMVAALSVIEPTPEDTQDTILAQIEAHGGIESYQREHMRKRMDEKAADKAQAEALKR